MRERYLVVGFAGLFAALGVGIQGVGDNEIPRATAAIDHREAEIAASINYPVGADILSARRILQPKNPVPDNGYWGDGLECSPTERLLRRQVNAACSDLKQAFLEQGAFKIATNNDSELPKLVIKQKEAWDRSTRSILAMLTLGVGGFLLAMKGVSSKGSYK